jgi:hypothetical protein
VPPAGPAAGGIADLAYIHARSVAPLDERRPAPLTRGAPKSAALPILFKRGHP